MSDYQFLQFFAASLFVTMYSYGEASHNVRAERYKNIGLLGVALIILNWFVILCPSVAVGRIIMLLIVASFAKFGFWIIYKDK